MQGRDGEADIWLGGEVVTLGTANPSCGGSIPPRASRLSIAPYAEVVELVDTQDLKSCGRKAARVRIPPSAPTQHFVTLVRITI